eukprot:1325120-Pyramimonas_sp.AAC.1
MNCGDGRWQHCHPARAEKNAPNAGRRRTCEALGGEAQATERRQRGHCQRAACRTRTLRPVSTAQLPRERLS